MKAAFPILARRGQRTPRRWNQPAGSIVPGDEEPSRDRGMKDFPTIWTIRGFLLAQIALFLALMSIHFGLLIDGYRHRNAGATESLIVTILVIGLLLTWTPPLWSQRAATAAQCFATLGVLVGLFTIALGIGPRTVLDLSLDVVLLLMLIAGLASTTRGAGHIWL